MHTQPLPNQHEQDLPQNGEQLRGVQSAEEFYEKRQEIDERTKAAMSEAAERGLADYIETGIEAIEQVANTPEEEVMTDYAKLVMYTNLNIEHRNEKLASR